MLGLFKIGLIFMALTDAGLTIAGTVGGQVNLPPVIISTPNPSFIEGTADTYDMSQNFTDDGVSVVITNLINILPNGLSYNGNTHILTYDGIGIPSISQHQLQVDDQVNPIVTSNIFNIDIQVASAIIQWIPNVANDPDTGDAAIGRVVFWKLNTVFQTPIEVGLAITSHDFFDNGAVSGETVWGTVGTKFLRGVGSQPALVLINA